jgi:hypothetical protein
MYSRQSIFSNSIIIQTYGTLENPTHQATRKPVVASLCLWVNNTGTLSANPMFQQGIGLWMKGLSYYLFPIKPHVSA